MVSYVKIKEGDKLKDYEIYDIEGNARKLSSLVQKYLVIYFYPKDDTPGCTIEAKEFSKHIDEFKKNNAEVIGVSFDDENSHKKFCEKYKLTVKLMTDKDKIMSNELGVVSQKSIFGKKIELHNRTTLLLDKDLQVLKIWENVKPENHAKEVLEYIKTKG
ncbi:MAG: peroxiredoxin [Candidatus Anstonellales archaeon]